MIESQPDIIFLKYKINMEMDKLVSESLNEFLNEANMEMYYVVNTDPNYAYAIVDKNNETVWEGNKEETLTFLLRNAGVDNSFEAKTILTKADRFGGKGIVTGDTIHKKGLWGNQSKDFGPGVKIHGAPIMMQPFMINKEISKGRFETSRKTPEQVAKKQTRETNIKRKEGETERNAKFGITNKQRKEAERIERELVAKRRENMIKK